MSGSGQVVRALEGCRFSYQNERELQDGVAEALRLAGLEFKREHRFSTRDVVDFLVGRVALEVKVAGGRMAVLRQLLRYAEHAAVEAVVLVTSCAHHQVPAALGGKPVRVVFLGGLR